jgi:hypothetical protein
MAYIGAHAFGWSTRDEELNARRRRHYARGLAGLASPVVSLRNHAGGLMHDRRSDQ